MAFYREDPEVKVPRGACMQAQNGQSDLLSMGSSTGFGGGFGATGCSFADGRVAINEFVVDHAVSGWARCGRLSESA